MTTPTTPATAEYAVGMERAANAVRVLVLHPATPPVWSWNIKHPRQQAIDHIGGDVDGQVHLSTSADDRNETVVAVLSALVDIHSGELVIDDNPAASGKRLVRAVLSIAGARVVLWATIDRPVVCGECGMVGTSEYAHVSGGTRACPDCAGEIVRESEAEYGDDQAADAAAKATPTGGGVTLREWADRRKAVVLADTDTDRLYLCVSEGWESLTGLAMPHLGALPLAEVTTERVDAAADALRAAHVPEDEVEQVRTWVHQLLMTAVLDAVLDRDPLAAAGGIVG